MNRLKMKKYLFLLSLIVLAVCIISAYRFVTVPSTPMLVGHSAQCYESKVSQSFDVTRPLELVVWNIYKQMLNGWDSELTTISQNSQLVLLQEAQSDSELKDYLRQHHWYSEQVFAFATNDDIAGVMTLSKIKPQKACAFAQVEPLMRLPKSGLYTLFPLSNGETLAVVNIHSVNFTLDTVAFEQQLTSLVDEVKDQKGALIFAGDFNTWSIERLEIVRDIFSSIGMQEVTFQPDHRLQVFGYALDHIFYRGLQLENATTKQTEASDHAPLVATFRFQTTN